MAKKIIWVVVSSFMVLSLVMASCGPKEAPKVKIGEAEVKIEEKEEEPVKEEPVQKEEVAVPGKAVPWWEEVHGKPKYGGTLNLRLAADITVFDPWYRTTDTLQSDFLGAERLFEYNYTEPSQQVQKEKYQSLASLATPWSVGITNFLPALAESWEQVDPVTYLIHLKKGVRWWNKPPVNGREFTAYDVEYHWHRILGLGKYGFTTPSPFAGIAAMANCIGVEAIDKYTVSWKFKEESFSNADLILKGVAPQKYAAPKEAVDLWGDKYNDWKNIIATGPLIPANYVTSSIFTVERNPNYHGYDARYPENQLPYYDRARIYIIPDASTTVAALRVGKLDFHSGLTWEEADSLKKTTPQLKWTFRLDSGGGANMRVNKEPFTDIRVRKAMQMAMDLKTLAATYYGGYVDPTPVGFQLWDGAVPYEKWPQELKDDFAYNPEGAKKLLAEAGYPKGFKVTMAASGTTPSALALVVKAWLLDIGVDMGIQMFDSASYTAWAIAGKDVMNWSGSSGVNWDWPIAYTRSLGGNRLNYTNNNDPYYDQLYDKALKAKSVEERTRLAEEMFMYDLKAHWRIYLLPSPQIMMWWPWMKGYDGECFHTAWIAIYLKHWWIDTDLKKTMGY